MADVVIHNPIGESFDNLDVSLIRDHATLTISSPGLFVFSRPHIDENFRGFGFTYNNPNGWPDSGTINYYSKFRGALDSELSLEISNFAVSVSTFNGFMQAGDTVGWLALLFDGHDSLVGGIGPDLMRGFDGLDTLRGDAGDDTLFGGDGDDTLEGEKDNDMLFGNGGNDKLRGSVGNDTLAGNSGDDTVQGGGGDDKVHGNGGVDKVYGGSGNDKLTGSAGTDTLQGGNGNDTLFGNGDDDKLVGGDGDDKLVGVKGNNKLFGGQGNDTLKGGTGNDTMSGGADADRFEFNQGDGADVINGFSPAQGDVIRLQNIAGFDDFADVQAAAGQVGADTVIDLGGGNSITLTNTLVGDLSAADFLFT